MVLRGVIEANQGGAQRSDLPQQPQRPNPQLLHPTIPCAPSGASFGLKGQLVEFQGLRNFCRPSISTETQPKTQTLKSRSARKVSRKIFSESPNGGSPTPWVPNQKLEVRHETLLGREMRTAQEQGGRGTTETSAAPGSSDFSEHSTPKFTITPLWPNMSLFCKSTCQPAYITGKSQDSTRKPQTERTRPVHRAGGLRLEMVWVLVVWIVAKSGT